MTEFLSVDPGRRTGVSLVHYTDETPAVLLRSWDISGGALGFVEWLHSEDARNEMSRGLPYFIVYESFDLREGKHGVDLSPVEVIGALKFLGYEYNIPLHLQPPAGRLRAVSDDVLRKFDMYLPGKAHRNERESNRHALWYLKRNKHRPTIIKGWG